jgi:hypothetical protein
VIYGLFLFRQGVDMKGIRAGTIWLVLFLLILVSCRSTQPDKPPEAVDGTAEVALPSASVTSPASPEPSPVPTETPQPGLAVLFAPPGSDPDLAARFLETLQPRFSDLGLRWESRPELAAADLAGSEILLVIALPGSQESPDPGLAALAAAAPQVQFLAVGILGLQPAANLSLVGSQGLRPDRQGFIAGVIAAMITPDWRVGSLGPAEPQAARNTRQGFLNGAVYFCGLCLPYHGPTNIDYPVFWDLPAGASPEEVQAALQGLKDLAVATVYLPPGTFNPGLAAPLAESGLQIIGSSAPPPELAASWVVSIQVDPLPAVLDLLPALLGGQGGQSLDLEISLLNPNEDLFSPGRQRRALEILAELQAGYIDPGLDLLEP